MKNRMTIREEAIAAYKKNPSLKELQKLKNLGIGIKEIKDNKWCRLNEYTLPVRFVTLYNDAFYPTDIGVY